MSNTPDSIKIHSLNEKPARGFRYVLRTGQLSMAHGHREYPEADHPSNVVGWIYDNVFTEEDEGSGHSSVVLYCQEEPSPNHQEIKIPGGGSLYIRASPTFLSVSESLEQASVSSSETLLNAVPRPPVPREGEWWLCKIAEASTKEQVLIYENGYFRHGKGSLERYLNVTPLYKMDRANSN